MTSQPMTDTTALSVEAALRLTCQDGGFACRELKQAQATIAQSAAREAAPVEDINAALESRHLPAYLHTMFKGTLARTGPAAQALLTRLESAEGERDVLTADLQKQASNVEFFRQRAESAEREVAHWKANHDHIKERIRVLLDRPDLPNPRKHVLEYFDKTIGDLEREVARLRGMQP